MPIRKTL